MFLMLLEAMVLASSLSIDAFIASFAYGSNQIKIPMLSAQIINLVCSLMLGLSVFVGAMIKPYLPSWLAVSISFGILFILGMIKLLDSLTKSWIKKHDNLEIKFSMLHIKLILRLYANPVEADVDESKTISPMEALSLAAALSLDGMAVGFGAAFTNIHILALLIASLAVNALAVGLGCFVGRKIARKIPFNLSWLTGMILIIMAFMKL